MLKAIHPLLDRDLLYVLSSMGHGDEIAIVDANFPAARLARRLVCMRGVNSAAMATAILTVLALDDTVPWPMSIMHAHDDPSVDATAIDSLRVALISAAGDGSRIAALERFDFYQRASAAYAIVATGELRPYGNLLLTMGSVNGC